MLTSADSAGLNISLEDHLLEALRPLPPLLPTELSEKLASYVSPPIPPTIPYALLLSVSRHARSAAFRASIQSHPTPPLDPQSYTMIALLAGTTTSPERTFPKYVSKEVKADEERKRTMNDKKAITTLLNALLSIVGSGAATWLAAQRTGWREEWVCLPFFFIASRSCSEEPSRGCSCHSVWPSWSLCLKQFCTSYGNPDTRPHEWRGLSLSHHGGIKRMRTGKRRILNMFRSRGSLSTPGYVNGRKYRIQNEDRICTMNLDVYFTYSSTQLHSSSEHPSQGTIESGLTKLDKYRT